MNRLLPSLKHIEIQVLVRLCVITALFFSFWEIVDDTLEGDTRGIDTKILLSLRDPDNLANPLGPVWLHDVMRDISALGGIAILTLLSFVTVVYLLMEEDSRNALMVTVVVIGGTILSNLLKSGFDRPRPEFIPHDIIVYTSSFPSGHSFMSAVVYLTLGTMLAEHQKSRQLKWFFLGLAVFLTMTVGISRIYLGVHWPSDVLAGWCIGAFWAMLCSLVYEKILCRRVGK